MKVLAVVSLWLVALASGPALASSPFDGTWKVDPNSVTYSGGIFSLRVMGGAFVCVSCAGTPSIPTDGSPHPYDAAKNVIDALSVTILNDRQVQFIGSKAGAEISRRTMTVSADGQNLTELFVRAPAHPGAPPISTTILSRRTAPAPPGAHAVSGSWRRTEMRAMSDASAISKYHVTDKGVEWSTPAGVSYSATFGGPPVPQIGDPGHTYVTVKRVSDREIIETDMRNGQIADVYTLTVSLDGKSMIILDTSADGHVEKTVAHRF